ncbi:MAG: PCRF domain-containing protein, partial [Bacteroidales bacterium]|nr:PCRF domain-containing protein [Bacteroidales bacterium]
MFDIDNLKKEVAEKEKITQAPDFWNDPSEAEKQLKKIAGLKSWIKDYEEVETGHDDLTVLFDFHSEGEATDEEVEVQYKKALRFIENLE